MTADPDRIALTGCTLGELLTLDPFAGAEVVPDSTDRALVLSSLSVGEPDGSPTPGALVIMTGSPFPPPAGCAATLSRRRPRRPQDAPAIVLAPGASWGAVLEAVVNAIGSRGVTAHASVARATLRHQLLSDGRMGGVATAATRVLGVGVAIFDEYLDPLGEAGVSETQAGALAEAVARARGHGPAHPLGPFVEDERFAAERVRIGGPRLPGGVIVAWVPRPPTAAQRAVLAEVAEAVLLERSRDAVRVETEARLRGELMDELLAGEAAGRESIVRRGRLLGTDLAQGAVAVAGRLTDPHDEARTISDERILRRLLQQLRGALERDWPRALIDWHGGRLMGFLPTATAPTLGDDETRDAQGATLARRLLALARPTVPGFTLTLAVSRHTPEPERLGSALDEAGLALGIAARLGRTDQVMTFEETGTYKLLFQILAHHPEDLAAFYESTLGPLVRYDAQYNTNLLTTLATYLELDGNLAQTAAKLFTHRHTIRYRLDRIAEICGLQVARSDDREKLTLGLKAMRLLGRHNGVTSHPEEPAPQT
ncbi:MAG: helix-turn-helix domain-containing protein [Actinobacteria bacterium]|nr:helix-turn-helix domain-containing protein [Actinomycetota bacterium]